MTHMIHRNLRQTPPVAVSAQGDPMVPDFGQGITRSHVILDKATPGRLGAREVQVNNLIGDLGTACVARDHLRNTLIPSRPQVT